VTYPSYASYFEKRRECAHTFEWATWVGDKWRWNCSECGKDYLPIDHVDCTKCIAHPDDEPATAN
jgi:hypothetical protein